MSIQGLRKELNELKKGTACEKPIEVLLTSNPRTLTDYELFRCVQYYKPEIKTEDELTTELLKKMIESEA